MQETQVTGPTEAFLQGDIIQVVDAQGNGVDPPYGIIINADCDLAHCKIDGVVAYIPLFPFEAYFEKFWIPTFVDSRRRDIAEFVAQRCSLTDDLRETLDGWLKEEFAPQVAAKLSTTYFAKESELRSKLEELSLIANAEKFDWNLLKEIAGLQKGKDDEILTRYGRMALKNLGDGHFFLNEVVGLTSVGFVARMRRIYSLDSDCAFPTRSEFMSCVSSPGIFGIRIAKLSDLYRFKVAQLFALQYSRIGLPDEITSLNEFAVQAAISGLRWKDV